MKEDVINSTIAPSLPLPLLPLLEEDNLLKLTKDVSVSDRAQSHSFLISFQKIFSTCSFVSVFNEHLIAIITSLSFAQFCRTLCIACVGV